MNYLPMMNENQFGIALINQILKSIRLVIHRLPFFHGPICNLFFVELTLCNSIYLNYFLIALMLSLTFSKTT